MLRRGFALAAPLVAVALCAAPAHALDRVTYGTNWVAEPEHGGFYQAVADGTYRKYGLDVTIVPGGPQVNNRILVPVGKMDFVMIAGTLQPNPTTSGRNARPGRPTAPSSRSATRAARAR